MASRELKPSSNGISKHISFTVEAIESVIAIDGVHDNCIRLSYVNENSSKMIIHMYATVLG